MAKDKKKIGNSITIEGIKFKRAEVIWEDAYRGSRYDPKLFLADLKKGGLSASLICHTFGYTAKVGRKVAILMHYDGVVADVMVVPEGWLLKIKEL